MLKKLGMMAFIIVIFFSAACANPMTAQATKTVTATDSAASRLIAGHTWGQVGNTECSAEGCHPASYFVPVMMHFRADGTLVCDPPSPGKTFTYKISGRTFELVTKYDDGSEVKVISQITDLTEKSFTLVDAPNSDGIYNLHSFRRAD